MIAAHQDGAASAAPSRGERALAPTTRLSSAALGWLALTPLFAAYELALHANPHGARNAVELVTTRALGLLLPAPDALRSTLLGLVTFAALARLLARERGVPRRLLRIGLEGFAAAVVLGPLLVLLVAALGVAAPAAGAPSSVPALAPVGIACGGAAWEELLFRVALFAGLLALLEPGARALLGPRPAARGLAEALALLAGAALFAAAHLAPVLAPLGGGGEPFDAARFAWRALAGLALGVLYLWRGVGVAAWAHALFNLALALGAGPEVLTL